MRWQAMVKARVSVECAMELQMAGVVYALESHSYNISWEIRL